MVNMGEMCIVSAYIALIMHILPIFTIGIELCDHVMLLCVFLFEWPQLLKTITYSHCFQSITRTHM